MALPDTWRSQRFELTRRLGAGGFGVVYEAKDRERGGTVALKTLTRLDSRALLRFKREFRALADIDHPNLVAPFELLEEAGEWFFTMPLVEGVDLLTWVRGRGPETVPTASTERVRVDSLTVTMDANGAPEVAPGLGVISGEPRALATPDRLHAALPQLVVGVAALHQHGLVHRDLKPSNVLVDEDGVVRILDFGLVASRTSRDDAVLGTPAYMAPEQARGMVVGAAADWYAVGVMLYECLTGVLPFEGPVLGLIVAKQTKDPARPSEVVASVPAGLDQLAMDLLDRDPERRPHGPEILSRVGTPPAGAPALFTRPPKHVLVGRERELEELRSAMHDAEGGASVVVRLEGVSGAGKSALVDTFVRELEGRARIFVGRCYEQERVPFIALDGVIDGLAEVTATSERPELPESVTDLARLFPVLGDFAGLGRESPSPQEARRRGAAALAEVLRSLARRRPLLIHIDDAQWGDADSAALLAPLLTSDPVPGALFVLSHRSEAGISGPLLEALTEEGALDGARPISLGPLSDGDAERLALTILGRRDEQARTRAGRIAQEAGGHAMFVSELAHHAAESTVPATLDAMIDTRVARLDPPSQALLEVVALAGAPLPRRVVERAAGVGEASVATERSLRAGRFVRATGRRGDRSLSTYHDRIREVTLARLPEETRRARHLAIADALTDESEPATDLLSRHLHGAGEHERAMPHTLAAAERAMRSLAFGQAVLLYRRAIEHTPPDDPSLAPRVTALGDALVEAGRGTEAAEEFVRAASLVRGGAAAALRRRAVEQWIRAGRIDRGLDALGSALRTLSLPQWNNLPSAFVALGWETFWSRRTKPAPPTPESEVDPRLLARIDLLFSVGTALSLVEPIRGIAFTGRATRMALKTGEPKRCVRALMHLGMRECATGVAREPHADHYLSEARRIGATVDDLYRALIDLGEAYIRFLCGRFVQCAELAFRAEEHIAPRGATFRWELDAVLRAALKSQIFTGDYRAMRQRVEPLHSDAVARRDLFSQVGHSIRFIYFLALMDDDPDGATRILDEAIERWSGRKIFIQHWLESMSRMDVALYRGDGPAAHREMEARWPAIVRTQANRGQYAGIEARTIRARAAVAGGNLPLAEKMARRVDREGAPWGCALAALIRASILHHSDPERARDRFIEAAEALESADLRLFAAAARYRATGGDAELDSIGEQGVRRPEAFLNVLAPLPPS